MQFWFNSRFGFVQTAFINWILTDLNVFSVLDCFTINLFSLEVWIEHVFVFMRWLNHCWNYLTLCLGLSVNTTINNTGDDRNKKGSTNASAYYYCPLQPDCFQLDKEVFPPTVLCSNHHCWKLYSALLLILLDLRHQYHALFSWHFEVSFTIFICERR